MLKTICIKISTATAEDVCIIMCAAGQMKQWDLAVLTWMFFKSEKGHKCGAVQVVKSQRLIFMFSLN